MKAILIADLGYGDSGKGTITDFLTKKYGATTVVRYNGGANAAHNVVTDDGRHHTFAQFGSGTFHGAKTHLSQFVLVNPLNIMKEEAHLREVGVENPRKLLSIHWDAPVITPYHQEMNRIRERVRGAGRHGSCGQGIGETRVDHDTYGDLVPHMRDFLDSRENLVEKMRFIRDLKVSEMEKIGFRDETWKLADNGLLESIVDDYMYFGSHYCIQGDDFFRTLLEEDTIIFEGAQGVLLDERWGFQPYTTWTDTTFHNAEKLLEGYSGDIVKVGVIRSYMTRHGPGPFVTEDKDLSVPELHNKENKWQREFRVGNFDLVMLKYALDVISGVDTLALTHMDRLEENPTVKVAWSYRRGLYERIHDIEPLNPTSFPQQEELTQLLNECIPSYWDNVELADLPTVIDGYAQVRVGILSQGPKTSDKAVSEKFDSLLGTSIGIGI